jgi:6-phosphogluconolactonase
MKCLVYVSLAGEDKISIYALNPNRGKLTLQRDVLVSNAPGPLAVDPMHRFMYAGLRTTRELASFALDPDTGDLSPMGTVGTSGIQSDPCYITTDRTGRFLLSAYYHKGMVAVHPIGVDGSMGERAVQCLETAPHAHCIQTDPSNRFVYVPHTVPPNLILQFAFDEATGTLAPLDTAKAHVPEGLGPRHYCFHPARDMRSTSIPQGVSCTSPIGVMTASLALPSTRPQVV